MERGFTQVAKKREPGGEVVPQSKFYSDIELELEKGDTFNHNAMVSTARL